MIRIGFIGCGQVTEQLHLPALRSLRDVEVTDLADSDTERLQRVADQLGDPVRHAEAD